MSIKDRLMAEHSKENMEALADYIGSDSTLFAQLMESFFSEDERESQHAAWAVTHVLDTHPDLAYPYIEKMVRTLSKPVHDAILRSITRYLQTAPLEESLHDDIWENCSRLLMNAGTATAPKVFAMSILLRIVEIWPELGNELGFMIREQMPFGSAGFQNRGKKVLESIGKLTRDI